MKILYIAPYFSLRLGGVSEVVSKSAQQLAQRGHALTLLAGDTASEGQMERRYPFHLEYCRSLSRWGFYFTPMMIPWLHEHLAEFDIVHLHEFRTFQNILASTFAAQFPGPVFLTGHGTVQNIFERRRAKQLFDLLFQKRILSSVDTFVAVSPKEADDYASLGIATNRIRLIYNGVEAPASPLPPGSFPGMPESGQVILFLGRLHRLKKVDILLRAFAEFHRSRPGTCLVISGPDGGARHELEALATELGIREKVSFTGPIYGEAKGALYRSASVLAYPSAYEIFGLVPFEALQHGTPVVVTKDTGMGRIIAEARAGITVPRDDPSALANALAWVLDHPLEASQQVRAGQDFIAHNLTWEKIALQLELLYQERLEQANAGNRNSRV